MSRDLPLAMKRSPARQERVGEGARRTEKSMLLQAPVAGTPASEHACAAAQALRQHINAAII